jgi:fumarate reductase flavoprotein subunit
MAGLVAAARARELGAAPEIYEKGDRPGGSMLLSSGFAWRYRNFETFRDQCPAGDPALQRLILQRFDDALDWLETQGVELLTRETGNALTVGARFGPRQLVKTLARDVRLLETTREPTILATGGFPVRLAREHGLLVRANPWSEGDGLELARARGAATAGDLDEFYGRAMPAVETLAEEEFVPLSQLYGRFASVTTQDGTQRFEGPPTWSETDLVQRMARWPGGRAWFTVETSLLDERVRERTVGEMVEAARAAGAPVREENGRVSVLVRAAVTQTLGGIAVDEAARVVREDGSPVEGLYAAGADAGGISGGGWASGLGTALVLGLVAAESALA